VVTVLPAARSRGHTGSPSARPRSTSRGSRRTCGTRASRGSRRCRPGRSAAAGAHAGGAYECCARERSPAGSSWPPAGRHFTGSSTGSRRPCRCTARWHSRRRGNAGHRRPHRPRCLSACMRRTTRPSARLDRHSRAIRSSGLRRRRRRRLQELRPPAGRRSTPPGGPVVGRRRRRRGRPAARPKRRSQGARGSRARPVHRGRTPGDRRPCVPRSRTCEPHSSSIAGRCRRLTAITSVRPCEPGRRTIDRSASSIRCYAAAARMDRRRPQSRQTAGRRRSDTLPGLSRRAE